MSVHELRSVPSDAKGASVGHRVYKPHGIKSPSPSPCTHGLAGWKVHARTLLFQPAAASHCGEPSERCESRVAHRKLCKAVCVVGLVVALLIVRVLIEVVLVRVLI